MSVKLKPLADKVLVKRTEAESMTKGGIVLPDSAKEKPRRGEIIALGNGRLLNDGTRSDFQVKVGDLVIFSPYGGSEIKIDGQEYLILEESEILAVVE